MKLIITERQLNNLKEVLSADVVKNIASVIYTDKEDNSDSKKTKSIDIDKINKNQIKTQSKIEKSYNSIVNNLVNKIKNNSKIPPIIVYKKGDKYVVLDGHHRVDAYKKAKKDKIKALVIPFNNVNFYKKVTKKMEKELDKYTK